MHPFTNWNMEWLIYGNGRAQKNKSVIKTLNTPKYSSNAFTKMCINWPLALWSHTHLTTCTHKHLFKYAQLSVQLTQKATTLKYLSYTSRATGRKKKVWHYCSTSSCSEPVTMVKVTTMWTYHFNNSMTIYLAIPPKLSATMYFTFYGRHIAIWQLYNTEN